MRKNDLVEIPHPTNLKFHPDSICRAIPSAVRITIEWKIKVFFGKNRKIWNTYTLKSHFCDQ